LLHVPGCVGASGSTYNVYPFGKCSLHCLDLFFSWVLQTCLSKGRGFHFPPCHMLNFCGIRILLDCPLDLSALLAFSPIPTSLDWLSVVESYNTEANDFDSRAGFGKRQKIEKLLHAKSLLFAEPWYKTVNNLQLWNSSFIDVVLISSPMGIMGLPFLTRMKGFSAKVVFLMLLLDYVLIFY